MFLRILDTSGSKLGKQLPKQNLVAKCSRRLASLLKVGNCIRCRRLAQAIGGHGRSSLDAVSGWTKPWTQPAFRGTLCHSDQSHNYKRPRCNYYTHVFFELVVVASVHRSAHNLSFIRLVRALGNTPGSRGRCTCDVVRSKVVPELPVLTLELENNKKLWITLFQSFPYFSQSWFWNSVKCFGSFGKIQDFFL